MDEQDPNRWEVLLEEQYGSPPTCSAVGCEHAARQRVVYSPRVLFCVHHAATSDSAVEPIPGAP